MEIRVEPKILHWNSAPNLILCHYQFSFSLYSICGFITYGAIGIWALRALILHISVMQVEKQSSCSLVSAIRGFSFYCNSSSPSLVFWSFFSFHLASDPWKNQAHCTSVSHSGRSAYLELRSLTREAYAFVRAWVREGTYWADLFIYLLCQYCNTKEKKKVMVLTLFSKVCHWGGGERGDGRGTEK